MLAMEKQSFYRIEKKYLIARPIQRRLMSIIKKEMKPDEYYKSEIFNIYFDDNDFNIINQSIDWVDFKHKLRARSYKGYDRVFFEIKTKIKSRDDNLGYKRRVMITRKGFKELVSKHKTMKELVASQCRNPAPKDLQIAKEIDYLIQYLNLSPRILISYKRTSFRDDNGLRITFDENLKYRTHDFKFVRQKDDKIFFRDDHNIIMELKSQEALPLWLTHELSENKTYARRFSKIGNIYQRIRKENNV